MSEDTLPIYGIDWKLIRYAQINSFRGHVRGIIVELLRDFRLCPHFILRYSRSDRSRLDDQNCTGIERMNEKTGIEPVKPTYLGEQYFTSDVIQQWEDMSPEEKRKYERKVMWKVDLRTVPWLSLLYLLCFLDRTNIGNAKIFGV